jgi:hypothetical protein
MNIGDRITFTIKDNLVKDVIKCTGIIKRHIFGRLWLVTPDSNPRLSGIDMQIHESWVKEAG